jgi:hypothetical protein
VKPSHLMTTADVSVIESLADWDTPALSNALHALRLQPQHRRAYAVSVGSGGPETATTLALVLSSAASDRS